MDYKKVLYEKKLEYYKNNLNIYKFNKYFSKRFLCLDNLNQNGGGIIELTDEIDKGTDIAYTIKVPIPSTATITKEEHLGKGGYGSVRKYTITKTPVSLSKEINDLTKEQTDIIVIKSFLSDIGHYNYQTEKANMKLINKYFNNTCYQLYLYSDKEHLLGYKYMGDTLLELIENGSISNLSLYAKFKLIKAFIEQISNLIIGDNTWIVHNDIKLDNITIKDINAFENKTINDMKLCNVSLIDFGISYFSEYGLPRQLDTNPTAFSPAYILLTKRLQEHISSYTIEDLYQLQFWGILSIIYDVIMDNRLFFSHRVDSKNNITSYDLYNINDTEKYNELTMSKIPLLQNYLKVILIKNIKETLKALNMLFKSALLSHIDHLINMLIMEIGNLIELNKVINDILELLLTHSNPP